MKNTIFLPAMRLFTVSSLLLGCVSAALAQSQTGSGSRKTDFPDTGWGNYGGDPGGMRYSAARQVDRKNVAQLKVAWTHRTGALDVQTSLVRKAAFEATPILIEGKLVLSTQYDHVIALDPQNGAKLWEYDPGVNLQRDYSEVASRGVSAWVDVKAKPGQACRLQIFIGTLDGRLIALDGVTGKLCVAFGANGEIDLNRDAATRTEWTGGYQVTSAPAIYRDLVITGSSIADNWKVDTGRGIVRAFDARTGKLRWTWDPIPWAKDTKPRTGAGNAWSTLSVDAAHDLVFIPTSSAAPDYYGGIRKGDNKWANAVVALRASTGAFVWGFQVVHHDLWDYDVAAQPTLFAWKDGTPAVVIRMALVMRSSSRSPSISTRPAWLTRKFRLWRKRGTHASGMMRQPSTGACGRLRRACRDFPQRDWRIALRMPNAPRRSARGQC